MVFLHQGLMKVQCACLLLLLLSAAVLSQTYKDFKRKHILPRKGSHDCNNMMINVNDINQCKSINTFMKDKVTLVVALCSTKKKGVCHPQIWCHWLHNDKQQTLFIPNANTQKKQKDKMWKWPTCTPWGLKYQVSMMP